MNSLDRHIACLSGLAIGDALGAPFEGMKAGHIRQVAGEVEGWLDAEELFPDEPRRWRLAGLYTAFTQQALAVADALCEDGDLIPDALAQLFVQLCGDGSSERGRFGSWRGADSDLRVAINAMADGQEPLNCGRPSPNIAAAVRAIPAGLYFRDDPQSMAQAAIHAALITHNDPRAVAAAGAVARAVSLLVAADDPLRLEVEAICQELIRFTRELEGRLKDEYWDSLDPAMRIFGAHHISETLGALWACVREGDDDLTRRTIIAQANLCGPEHPIKDTTQGFAPAAATMCLYFALSRGNFLQAVRAAVNEGRATCSVGAIVGALAGARFGVEQIPDEWREGLLNREQVELRGRMLHERETDWSQREFLPQMEHTWTRQEREHFADSLRRLERSQAKHAEKHPPKPKKPKSKPYTGPDPAEIIGPYDADWISGGADPETRRKERAQRGRKRIEWKEERRRKHKHGMDEESD
ncbi:ADP-ribosylglycohydrolase family protein [Candidatus Sumerlaeota bacterium]|nr:ADP-ribosylglycohydrolase family protein [Candidatus Sumerlaeota bacterium]